MYIRAQVINKTHPVWQKTIRGIAALLLFSSAIYSIPSSAQQAPWVGQTLNGARCSGGAQGFGPYDYLRKAIYADKLSLVETHHFTAKVESLRSGQSGELTNDLDYTLRAWPNHHRALYSMSIYAHEYNRKKVSQALNSMPECYFQRAIFFSPKDSTTLMLFGMYLQKSKHNELAAKQYESAVAISPNNPQLRYNYGLLLFEMGKYERSREEARQAYALDFPLPGLQRKLEKAGHWEE